MPAAISYSDQIDRYVSRHAMRPRCYAASIEPTIRVHYDDIPADIRELVISEFDAGNNHIVIERAVTVSFDIDEDGAHSPILTTTRFGYEREVDAFISSQLIDWLDTEEADETLSEIAHNNGWLSVRSMREEHGTW